MINNVSLNVVQWEITEYKYKLCTDVFSIIEVTVNSNDSVVTVQVHIMVT